MGPVTELNSPGDEGHLTLEEFTDEDHSWFYFSRSSDRGRDWDPYLALRRADGGFDPPDVYAPGYLQTTEFEGRMTRSEGGSTRFVSAARASEGLGGADIFTMEAEGLFLVLELSSEYDDNGPALVPYDPYAIYLSRVTAGDFGDILRASCPDVCAFRSVSEPEPVDSVNTGSAEIHPSITEREAVLLFASNRPGGAGGFDLWYSIRIGGTFSAPRLVPDVNTVNDELDPEVSSDGCELFFVTHSGSGSDTDIHRALHRH
jgi:hypothetical protein